MSSVIGLAPQALFPTGLERPPGMPAVVQPRQDSPLFNPVAETAATARNENRRELDPDERRQNNQRGQPLALSARDQSESEETEADSVRTSRQALEEAERRGELNTQERQRLERIQELSQRDREVRQHEMAHKAVAGQYAGPIRYEYAQGPDGRRYAIAGEVPLDLSPAPTAEETIAKMEQIRRAAMVPSEPSPADRRIAAEATQLILDARAEVLRQQRLESEQQAAIQAERTDLRQDNASLRLDDDMALEQDRVEDDEESDAALDERQSAMNTELELRRAEIQAAISELLRNQSASLDQVTLGRNVNFQI